MPKIAYREIKFRDKSLELISLINQVISEYEAQGFNLTLRQVYYQLAARGYTSQSEMWNAARRLIRQDELDEVSPHKQWEKDYEERLV